MNWRRIILYSIVGISLLLAVQIALSVVWVIFGLIWSIATLLVTLAVLGVIGYAGVKFLLWYFDSGACPTADGDTKSSDAADANSVNRIKRLKDRYANGDLSENEFERRLEHELTDPDIDNIDRELSREHE
jgi:uncharacterized membrane protein